MLRPTARSGAAGMSHLKVDADDYADLAATVEVFQISSA